MVNWTTNDNLTNSNESRKFHFPSKVGSLQTPTFLTTFLSRWPTLIGLALTTSWLKFEARQDYQVGQFPAPKQNITNTSYTATVCLYEFLPAPKPKRKDWSRDRPLFLAGPKFGLDARAPVRKLQFRWCHPLRLTLSVGYLNFLLKLEWRSNQTRESPIGPSLILLCCVVFSLQTRS